MAFKKRKKIRQKLDENHDPEKKYIFFDKTITTSNEFELVST